MDFAYSEDQQAIGDLARQILSDKASHERVSEIEKSGGDRFDSELWRALGEAGLVGIAVPEEFGGGGLGFLELALIIEQIGRRAAPIPFLESTVMAGLPLNEFGSDAQKAAWLPKLASGAAILTAALVEGEADPERPTTLARPDGDGFRLTGTKLCVPAGQLADCILLSASTGEGAASVFLVDPRSEGVSLTPLITTSGQPEARLKLDDVAVGVADVLGDPRGGRAIIEWIVERTNAALCSLAAGVCDEALSITAEYTKTRKQFDVPIASFQAVGQRAADAYIDAEAVRLTALQAAWRISEGLPAANATAAAKVWAAEGGQRVVHTAQHLHGGVGVDRDYPVHRYFLYAKQLELTLGGGTRQLLKLGAMLAAE